MKAERAMAAKCSIFCLFQKLRRCRRGDGGDEKRHLTANKNRNGF